MRKIIIGLLTFYSPYLLAQLDLSFGLKTYSTERKFKPSDLIINRPVDFSSKVRVDQEPVVTVNKVRPATVFRVSTSPAMVKIPQFQIQTVTPAKTIIAAAQALTAPPVNPLTKIKDPVIKTAEPVILAITDIENDEYKMLQGLIFYDVQKKYDVSMSLFVELFSSNRFKHQAQLKYAEAAYAQDLFSEYRNTVLKLLDSAQDKSFKQKIIQSIVQNIKAMQTQDMSKIEPLVESFNLDVSKNDQYLYKRGKYFTKEENLVAADNSLSQISTKSELYFDAVLLSASINYRKGDVNKAIAKLEKVIPLIENNKKNKVRNMLILTLARMYFQKGKYNDSYQTYLKIDRSSPLWIQSVIEQAWAQILVGDHIGAAGNMFSLHTEFFKKIYMPESYIVRSVGYLNLCQYGDAMHVLTDLDSRFKKTFDVLKKFEGENSTEQAYYELVKSWYNNNKQTEINSVPRSFIAELAVHPSFTNFQQKINYLEDENAKFSKVISDFAGREPQIRQRILNYKNAKNELKTLTADLELQIVTRGIDGLKKMRQSAEQRSETDKVGLRNQAARSLKTRYSELTAVLGKLLEQEDILAYEIYSGAGEHIRFQMAGGKIEDRNPAALTPEEKKSYKWKFRGEVWEDEIGHYRSSLKNVCPHDDLAQKGDR